MSDAAQLQQFALLDAGTRAMLLELSEIKAPVKRSVFKCYDSGITASPVQILLAVCKTLQIAPETLRARHGQRVKLEGRQIAAFLLRTQNIHFKKIGQLFNIHYTTIIYYCDTHNDLMKVDKPYKEKYYRVVSSITKIQEGAIA